MITYRQILCIRLHAKERRESKTKDSISTSQFSDFFQWKKSAHDTCVNTVTQANFSGQNYLFIYLCCSSTSEKL